MCVLPGTIILIGIQTLSVALPYTVLTSFQKNIKLMSSRIEAYSLREKADSIRREAFIQLGREQGLGFEFLEDNDVVVIGLREGALLRVDRARESDELQVGLRGTAEARLFRRGASPSEHPSGAALTNLLTSR